MLVRLLDDLHIEKQAYDIVRLPEDKDSVLVLAGDICQWNLPELYVPFIEKACAQFRYVVYAPGNHEYFGGSWPHSIEFAKARLAHLSNLYLENNGVTLVDDVAFVVSATWTDLNNMDKKAIEICQDEFYDFSQIKTGSKLNPFERRINADDWVAAFRSATRMHMPNAIAFAKSRARKIVVVTHWLPHYESIPLKYRGAKSNAAFVSNLEPFILEHKPDYWFHGHTHLACKYPIGSTIIACNPRGYPKEYGFTDFNPGLTFDI